MPTESRWLYIPITLLLLAPCVVAENRSEIEGESFYDLTLVQLLNIRIDSVSGVEESVIDAPASLVIITANDIRKRAYNNFEEIFSDLPGFDAYITRGLHSVNAIQRGYRQPFFSRTLVLVNGRAQHSLSTHYKMIDRQLPMSRVERIEVLYGPVGVSYGPNAFLGVINIITKNSQAFSENKISGGVKLSYGSFDTREVEIGIIGKSDEFSYDIAGKFYDSDEANINDFGRQYDFYNKTDLANPAIFGPILQLESNGEPYGQYSNAGDQYGIFASVNYKDIRLFYNSIESNTGYGTTYLSRFVQPHGQWTYTSDQLGLEIDYQYNERIKIDALLSHRETDSRGFYVEAAENSYVSLSEWLNESESDLYLANIEYRFNDTWLLVSGIKYQTKSIPAPAEICGYFNSSAPYCGSQLPIPGELGLGAGIFAPDTDNFEPPSSVTGNIPDIFIIDTIDKGIYAQAIYDYNKWRISAGLRYDENSIYGSTFNPRGTAIYRLNATNTIKLLYGKAFHEPQPNLLFADFAGRTTSASTGPEEMSNLEAIYIHQRSHWLHEFSVYLSRFRNVIQEEPIPEGLSENRKVTGFEYRGRFTLDNYFNDADSISCYVYYTYTDAQSDIHYSYNRDSEDNVIGWQSGQSDTGDIAPHKLQAGVDLPINSYLSWNVRVNYHSKTKLYSRNPLRTVDRDLDAYTIVNTNVNWQLDSVTFVAKVNNLFDERYFVPGQEASNGGNTETEAAGIPVGFFSSLAPQPGRSYSLSIAVNF